uniref:Amidase domain-containing protein n=1 Tax=Trichobilharzia regenti TaxID=157069 RepID=A0AA85K6U9_TRIRE|nr:unnamed protein product [Trichobilharzia regenti]
MELKSAEVVIFAIPTALKWIIDNLLIKVMLPFGILFLIVYIGIYYQKKLELRRKLSRKQQLLIQRMDNLRKHLSTLNPELLSLTDLSLETLQQQLIEGKFTPVDLLHAYQMKALRLHDAGNSGVCEFLEEAEQLAVNLVNSNRLSKNKQTLVGIPISIKELCPAKGYDVTFGLIKRCNQPSDEDCCILKVLKHEGAIPFVLTATSQTALSLSGINPVFGDLSNPYSSNHETGGSSSGEGVLLALKGSPVGIGTDLGGSVRIPSVFCGLAGLKPTSGRLSNQGLATLGYKKSVSLRVSAGPMGKRVDDLAKLMRTLLTPKMFELDPSVPPLVFNEIIYEGRDKTNLCIGYYEALDDPSLIATVPSIRRAIRESVSVLKRNGHQVVPFNVPKPNWAYELCMKAVAIDFKYYVQSELFAEPLNEHTKMLTIIPSAPHCLKVLIDNLTKSAIGKPAAGTKYLDGARGEKEVLNLISDIEEYRREFQRAMEEAGDLDAIICPVFPFPAFPKSAKSLFVTPAIAYTILYNTLDYPAGTVSMGHVNRDDVEESKTLAENYKRSGDRFHSEVFKQQELSEGLPIGVQIVGKPWKEEVVLRIMKELETHRIQSE